MRYDLKCRVVGAVTLFAATSMLLKLIAWKHLTPTSSLITQGNNLFNDSVCSQSPEPPNFPCVLARLRGVEVPICVYTAGEDTVSAEFLSGSYWDADRVFQVIQVLREHPQAEFVDIGANLGAYSLAVARTLKRRVVSVEPTRETYRRLSRSVCLGELTSLVTLVHHAVSSDRRVVRLASVPGNLGATVILNDTRCVLTRDQIQCINESIKTIILDDLIPKLTSRAAILKVDTEGSEIKIFNEQTAAKFFKEVDVLMVSMEFVYCTRFHVKDVEKKILVDGMLDFFQSRGYRAWSLDGGEVPPKNWTAWPDDVVWRKGT